MLNFIFINLVYFGQVFGRRIRLFSWRSLVYCQTPFNVECFSQSYKYSKYYMLLILPAFVWSAGVGILPFFLIEKKSPTTMTSSFVWTLPCRFLYVAQNNCRRQSSVPMESVHYVYYIWVLTEWVDVVKTNVKISLLVNTNAN